MEISRSQVITILSQLVFMQFTNQIWAYFFTKAWDSHLVKSHLVSRLSNKTSIGRLAIFVAMFVKLAPYPPTVTWYLSELLDMSTNLGCKKYIETVRICDTRYFQTLTQHTLSILNYLVSIYIYTYTHTDFNSYILLTDEKNWPHVHDPAWLASLLSNQSYRTYSTKFKYT